MTTSASIGCSVGLLGVFALLSRNSFGAERVLGPLLPSPSDPRRSAARLQGRMWRIIVVIVGAALGAVVAGPAGSVVGAGGCLGAQAVSRRRRAKRRADLLEFQLADAVGSLAAALRSGLSLSQAVAYSAVEVEDPLASTLARVAQRESFGEPLEFAFDRWSDEVGGDDARLVTGVLALHRRSGGDLPRVLDRVGDALRARRATAREVRGLTAQARLSGAILGCLPIGFFLFMLLTSRRDMEAAFQTAPGIAAIAVGLTMEALAFLWIRKLLRVT
jgi:tight adherence protein B